jgi:tRNA dimethylallyltransferase
VAVVGPTASGKTAFAVSLAERLQGELLSADSRQVYRECRIGTNKPGPAELRGIRCHLLDVVDPGTPFTVADYCLLAAAAIEDIGGRGKPVVLQGGTGLYVRALLEGWDFANSPPDFQLRKRLEERVAREGLAPLMAELERVDPEAARRVQGNPRRLVRALEIHAISGQPPSRVRGARRPPWRTLILGLNVPLSEIDRLIAIRVDAMLEAGWLDEVAAVRARYPGADLRRLGHGYPELAAVQDGHLTLEEARARTVRQVRQYARRQLTWFRAEKGVQWIEPRMEAAEPLLGAAMIGQEAI